MKDKLLSEATVQELHFELIRRASVNEFNGQHVLASLLRHRELWKAVLIDRPGAHFGGPFADQCLVKLRDLPDNLWNVDTLWILCPDAPSARQLAQVAEQDEWRADDVTVYDRPDDIQSALGVHSRTYAPAVLQCWWD